MAADYSAIFTTSTPVNHLANTLEQELHKIIIECDPSTTSSTKTINLSLTQTLNVSWSRRHAPSRRHNAPTDSETGHASSTTRRRPRRSAASPRIKFIPRGGGQNYSSVLSTSSPEHISYSILHAWYSSYLILIPDCFSFRKFIKLWLMTWKVYWSPQWAHVGQPFHSKICFPPRTKHHAWYEYLLVLGHLLHQGPLLLRQLTHQRTAPKDNNNNNNNKIYHKQNNKW